MGDLKTVGIKELKNKLSAYLREVGRGTRVLITDRETVVAELREVGAVSLEVPNPLMAAWVEAGQVRLPLASKQDLPESPVHLPEGTSLELLYEMRRDEGV